jgi:phosphoribosylformylglycinamidine cyclo-ligase
MKRASGSADRYRAAGVDLEKKETALREIARLARSTSTESVLADVGLFGGLFRFPVGQYRDPVLVASADGVGTKLLVAKMARDYSTVGVDLVHHCVNDILVQGARPLFFLDYVAGGTLEPGDLVSLVQGISRACREHGCALVGGETAEMPGVYQPGDYDLVGFIVGVVERDDLLDGSRVREGDLLFGLRSSGLHTNGYSLARKIFFEEKKLRLGDPIPGDPDKRRVGEWLLTVHRSYFPVLGPVLKHPGLHALAHVTGGGLTDNLPRVLPAGLQALVRFGSWEIPYPFRWLQEAGDLELDELLRVFNCGIGMVAVVAKEQAADFVRRLVEQGEHPVAIGSVQRGERGVIYDLGATEGGILG